MNEYIDPITKYTLRNLTRVVLSALLWELVFEVARLQELSLEMGCLKSKPVIEPEEAVKTDMEMDSATPTKRKFLQ